MNPFRPLIAAASLSLALAGTAAMAQPYDDYAPPPPPYGDEAPAYDNAPPTTVPGVTVYASPRIVGRSAIGAPIEVHREHVVVPIADLDLSTDWGLQALRYRIRRAASDACQDVNDRYPVSADDGDDCYGRAVRRAFDEVAYETGYAP
jgi:UrcA family protein